MPTAKRVESWGDINPKVFKKFVEAVEKLRDEMIPRDCDGDSPIDYLIVNRMTYEPIGYFPVPKHEVYSYETHSYVEVHPARQQELEDEAERELSANVRMAASALDRYMQIKYHRNALARDAKRPFGERIARACELCAKGEGFDPENEKDHYQNLRQRYPGYPAYCHKSGEKCKAFDIRRQQFLHEHPEYGGTQPEPRYCSDQECRALLRNEDSRKGSRDRDICPVCGRKNNPPAAAAAASK